MILLYSIQTFRLEITIMWIHLVLIQSKFTIHYYQGWRLPRCGLIRDSYNLISLFYYHFITFTYCKGGNYCLNMRGKMECTYLKVEDDDEDLEDDRWQLSIKFWEDRILAEIEGELKNWNIGPREGTKKGEINQMGTILFRSHSFVKCAWTVCKIYK